MTGVVERHLGSAVDAHNFCAPGKSRTREEAVKVILIYGQHTLEEGRRVFSLRLKLILPAFKGTC